MAPLGLGTGFYGLGPTMNSDSAAAVVIPKGTAVKTNDGNVQGLYFEASVLQSTFRASFTMAIWAKLVDGQPSSAQVLIGNLGDGNNHCILQINTDGTVTFDFQGDGDSHQNKTDDVIFTNGANAYKHIAVTMTIVGGGNSTSIIYVDGAAIATTIVGGAEISEAKHAAWAHGSDNFGIGAMGTRTSLSNITSSGLAADLAEFAIWNIALDAAAIAKVEDLGVPTDSNFPNLLVDAADYDVSSRLVTYHKLNDYSGGFATEQIVGFDDYTGVLVGDSKFV